MTDENNKSDGDFSATTNKKAFAEHLAKLSKLKVESNSKKPGLKRSYFLLFSSIFLSLGVIWWLNFVDQTSNIEVNINQISETEAGTIKMTGARFASRTSEGENFEINAEQAVDNMPRAGLIHLSKPNGTIWTKKGNIIKITSFEAILDQTSERTLFQGTVRINQTKPKANINTSELSVDLLTKIYQSKQPVLVVAGNMTITGEDMSINQESGILQFGGHAKLTIVENKQQK